MKFKLKLVQASMIAAMAMASTASMAVVFNDFQVTEGSVPGASTNTFTADKITGNYVEVVTFSGGATGTFDTSIKWQAGQFVANDGTTPVENQLGLGTINSNQYMLYALLQGTGTYSTDSTGVTSFFFNSGGSLNVWIDPDSNTTFTAPGTGAGAWTTGNTADPDYLIATGALFGGQGTLDPTCAGGGINCGSFGTSTSFLLTALGSAYFTAPNPFYNVSFQSGQLNNFTVSGTQTINGSLDVVFASVPEPSSIALLGMGLLGMGLGLRRRKQA